MSILGGFATNGGTSIFVLSCGILTGLSTTFVPIFVPGKSTAGFSGCTITAGGAVTLIGSFTVVFPVVGISNGVSFGVKSATGKGFVFKSLA